MNDQLEKLIKDDKILQKYRRIYIITICIFSPILLLLLLYIISTKAFFPNIFFLFFTFVLLTLLLSITTSKYNKHYKNEIIKETIEKEIPNLTYNGFQGIQEHIYRYANFESYDKYESEDLIEGTIKDIPFFLSDAHTYDETTDDEGDTHYITQFQGAFAYIKNNKNINNFIHIINNALFNSKKNKVTIDNDEFEKIYDIYGSDEVLTARILTPDITTLILELRNKYNIHLEIKLINEHIFFRFYTKDLFEPHILNPQKEATEAKKYFVIIKNIMIIIENILNIIEEVQL